MKGPSNNEIAGNEKDSICGMFKAFSQVYQFKIRVEAGG
jgi:hypothetical protein